MDRNRYQAQDVIGSGGMATVWRARDTLLDRLVAIKRPNPAPEGMIQTTPFAREARAAASVTHPNLVAVFDTGVDETGPYLVMELVEGPSLADTSLAPDQVARVGAEVASALAALHHAGIVHGDVKPANILLSHERAKLTDFGIARFVDDTTADGQAAVAFGTPAYAAPETTSNAERSPAGDVYSLAVTLHELLTGTRWNDSIGTTQVMPASDWARVLTPALAANPTERPTSTAFAASLAALDGDADPAPPTIPLPVATSSGGSPGTPPVANPRTRRGIVVGVVVLVVAAVAIVLAIALRDRNVTSADRPDATTVSSVDSGSPLPPSSTPATAPPSAPATSPATAPAATNAAAVSEPTERVVAELTSLIDAVPRNELRPKDAEDLIERIDDVVRTTASEPEQAEGKLREAAEQIAKNIDDRATLDEAERLLVELADVLALPHEVVSDAFESRD